YRHIGCLDEDEAVLPALVLDKQSPGCQRVGRHHYSDAAKKIERLILQAAFCDCDGEHENCGLRIAYFGLQLWIASIRNQMISTFCPWLRKRVASLKADTMSSVALNGVASLASAAAFACFAATNCASQSRQSEKPTAGSGYPNFASN